MSATVPPPAWTDLRPWRNNNPGDLRVLSGDQMWDGQTDIDWGVGGPFAIFSTRQMGWRALAVCLLTYYTVHGICTIQDIVERYAPGLENNVEDYVDIVCGKTGWGPNIILSLESGTTMGTLCYGIALAEGGARILWPAAEHDAGIALALEGKP